jgi:shikimate dehydrogenase
LGFDFGKGHAAVLGAGGAAAAVAAALRARGMHVRAAARRPGALTGMPGVVSVPWERLGDAAGGARLLVNATPLGMGGAQFESFEFLDALPRGATVYDLVYDPPQTLLLSQAAARGLAAVNGIPMLVSQAALSFEFITGERPPAESVAEAERAIDKTIKHYH